VWFAVRLVLRPLMRLKTEVETRELSDLSDVDQALVHREVRPLVAAMNGTMARMQNLIASQRRFIADASHQLRTPLTVLKTQAELALREDDPQALRAIVRSMAGTTDSAVQLANGLLALARIEQGNQAAAMVQVELDDIVRQVCIELAPQALQKGIDLSLDAAAEVPARGQALMLHEMASNLLDNAIRYTPAGGKVALRVFAEGGKACMEVEDSGAGIPEAERDKVFTPFYRLSQSMEVNPGGAGLGMAIVRDIAAVHGATVELAAGAGGKGLLVRVVFPG
jgi:two-component system, OmpR family, sensor histidine kinase TctE